MLLIFKTCEICWKNSNQKLTYASLTRLLRAGKMRWGRLSMTRGDASELEFIPSNMLVVWAEMLASVG